MDTKILMIETVRQRKTCVLQARNDIAQGNADPEKEYGGSRLSQMRECLITNRRKAALLDQISSSAGSCQMSDQKESQNLDDEVVDADVSLMSNSDGGQICQKQLKALSQSQTSLSDEDGDVVRIFVFVSLL
jgi:hypothetical protein